MRSWIGTSAGRMVYPLAAFVLFASACAGADPSDDDGAEPVDEGAEAGETEPDGPSGPSVVRTSLAREVLTMHPHLIESNNIPTVQVGRHIYDRLIVRDGADHVGQLAESWEIVDDNTWVFDLRDDAFFHNGDPVTAHDVVASMNKTVEEDGPLASYWTQLDMIVALDDHTVEITTTSPKGDMLASWEMLFIAPADLLDDPEFSERPVGSGPYVLTEWQRGSRIVVERNEDYWGELPNVERIEFYEMPEESTRVTALLNNELDIIPLDPDSISTVEGSNQARVESAPSWQYYYLWPNHTKEGLGETEVRQAIAHAIDMQALADDLFPDTGRVMRAPITQIATHAADLDPYPYDPERSRQLLEEAGYADGLQLGLQWASGDGPLIRDVATTIASYLQAVGITIELQERDAASFVDAREQQTYDLSLQRHSGALGNAASTVGRLYDSSEHRIAHEDPVYDQMVADALTVLDEDEQVVAWREAQEYIWDKAVVFWLLELDGIYGVSSGIADFDPGPDAARALFMNVQFAS